MSWRDNILAMEATRLEAERAPPSAPPPASSGPDPAHPSPSTAGAPLAHPLASHEPLDTWAPDIPRTWERLQRESDVGWACFLAYRDSAYPDGPSGRFAARDLPRIALSLGLPLHQIEQYANTYNWAIRAGAYDRALDNARTSADISEISRARARHLRILAKARSLVEKELDKYVERAERMSETGALKPREIESLLNLVLKSESALLTAQSAASTPTNPDQTRLNLDNLSLEELEALDNAMTKAEEPQ